MAAAVAILEVPIMAAEAAGSQSRPSFRSIPSYLWVIPLTQILLTSPNPRLPYQSQPSRPIWVTQTIHPVTILADCPNRQGQGIAAMTFLTGPSILPLSTLRSRRSGHRPPILEAQTVPHQLHRLHRTALARQVGAMMDRQEEATCQTCQSQTCRICRHRPPQRWMVQVATRPLCCNWVILKP